MDIAEVSIVNGCDVVAVGEHLAIFLRIVTSFALGILDHELRHHGRPTSNCQEIPKQRHTFTPQNTIHVFF
jgi:hypothetical protein